jgi:hypothetical protein
LDLIEVTILQVLDGIIRQEQSVKRGSMLKTGGNLFHGHMFEAEFAKGGTGLDEIEGNFDHWIS